DARNKLLQFPNELPLPEYGVKVAGAGHDHAATFREIGHQAAERSPAYGMFAVDRQGRVVHRSDEVDGQPGRVAELGERRGRPEEVRPAPRRAGGGSPPVREATEAHRTGPAAAAPRPEPSPLREEAIGHAREASRQLDARLPE